MVRRVLLVLSITLTLGLAVPVTARAAQQASPEPGPVCGGASQSIDELIALAFPQGTPVALPATPVVEVAEDELPQGAPADADTAAAVEQVVQTWLVCLAGDDAGRLFGLMTDAMDASFLQQYISHPAGDSPEELRTLLEFDLGDTLVIGSTSALAAPGREIRVLDDGRVGGIWTVDGNDAFIILAQEDGSWLVDEIIDIIKE